MWSRVAGIAGKGVTRAVEAASYVGEVIAPGPLEELEAEDAFPATATPEADISVVQEDSSVRYPQHPQQPGESERVQIWEEDEGISRKGWLEGPPTQDFGTPIGEARRVPGTLLMSEASSEEAEAEAEGGLMSTRGDAREKEEASEVGGIHTSPGGEATHLNVNVNDNVSEAETDEPLELGEESPPFLASTTPAPRLRGPKGGKSPGSQHSPAAYDAVAGVDGVGAGGLVALRLSNRHRHPQDLGGRVGEGLPAPVVQAHPGEVDSAMGPTELSSTVAAEDSWELPGAWQASKMPPPHEPAPVTNQQQKASADPSLLQPSIAKVVPPPVSVELRAVAPRGEQELRERLTRLSRELEEAQSREAESIEVSRCLSHELQQARSREAESVEQVRRRSSQELQQARSREAESAEETRRLTHLNDQLKQVIDQMRDLARRHSEEAKLLSEELGDAVKAKEAAEMEAAAARRQASELENCLGQALQRTDLQSSSAHEKDVVLQQLKQAQAEATEARVRAQESEEEMSARFASLQAMYQTALQQERQLRSRENALTADLALANQDKARLESALGNMRGVLEEFNAERMTDVKVVEARLREEMASREAEFEAAKSELQRLHEKEVIKCRREAEHALQTERRLRVRAEVETSRVARDVQRSRGALNDALTKLQGSQDDNLDRQLVKNLIVRYVSSSNKTQVLDLMARMFSFTEEDKEMIAPEDLSGRTLSDLWMDFLMTETDTKDEQDQPK